MEYTKGNAVPLVWDGSCMALCNSCSFFAYQDVPRYFAVSLFYRIFCWSRVACLHPYRSHHAAVVSRSWRPPRRNAILIRTLLPFLPLIVFHFFPLSFRLLSSFFICRPSDLFCGQLRARHKEGLLADRHGQRHRRRVARDVGQRRHPRLGYLAPRGTQGGREEDRKQSGAFT